MNNIQYQAILFNDFMNIKCKIFQCNDTANIPFECCSAEHGFELKANIAQMLKYQDLKVRWKGLYNGSSQIFGTPWTIEETKYYASLV